MNSNEDVSVGVNAVSECGIFDKFGRDAPVREGLFELFDDVMVVG
jgi:hypothetical protein